MAFLSFAEVVALNVWGVRPELLSLLTKLMARCESELGLRVFVRKFGGYRGAGVQAQLLAWRNKADAVDGIIGGGRDYYAVNPAGQSHHEWGAAFDLDIVDPTQRTDANYKRIADLSRSIGLVAGYYFRKRDEFHHQLDESLFDAQAKWKMMMKTRAVVLASVFGVFFFRAGFPT